MPHNLRPDSINDIRRRVNPPHPTPSFIKEKIECVLVALKKTREV